jgi:acetyl esterase/lipase
VSVPFVDLIDPRLRATFEALPPGLAADDVEGARQGNGGNGLLLDPAPRLEGVEVHDASVERTGDPGRVRVRIYRSTSWTPGGPGLLWMHGGGFISGCPELDDMFCQRVARELDVAVLSVDYRLAPEHPYPAALDDCQDVLAWSCRDDSGLALQRGRFAIAGISAGGALAAGMCLRLRDADAHLPALLLLQYPCLDDRQATPSSLTMNDPKVWNRTRSAWAWNAYLGASAEQPPIEAAPGRAEDLHGLPPTYVLAAGLDPARDEAVAFAAGLMMAGVETELHVIPAVFHGYDRYDPAAPVSRHTHAELLSALRRAL